MSNSDDIKEKIVDDLLAGGVRRKQIGDRSTEYFSLGEQYELAQKIAADEIDDDGPFLKMRFGE